MLILYHAAVTAAAQITLVRYVAVLSPFLLAVVGLLAATFARDLASLVAAAWRNSSRRGAVRAA